MALTLRRAIPADAAACGVIDYEAFEAIAEQHGFPPDFPSPEIATGVCAMLLAHPGIYGVVAELDGQIVGSNFLDERSAIAGIGPISVSPRVPSSAAGVAEFLNPVRSSRTPRGGQPLQGTASREPPKAAPGAVGGAACDRTTPLA